MRHVLSTFAICILFCTGCKKDAHNPDVIDTGKKYAISFNVSDFKQEFQNFDGRKGKVQARENLSEYIQHLYYVVFTQNHTFVKKIEQDSSEADFGMIKDSLPAGTYSISLLGSADTVGFSAISQNDLLAVTTLPGTDIFYRQAYIVVDDELHQEIELKRVVSKLKVVLEDPIPQGTAFISFTPLEAPALPNEFWVMPNAISLYSGERPVNPTYNQYVRLIAPNLYGTSNYTTEMYLLTPDTLHIALDIYWGKDLGSPFYDQKRIGNIVVAPNTKTVLSGRLFQSSNNQVDGVNAVIENGGWTPDSLVISF